MIASQLESLFLGRLGVDDDPAFWTAMLDAVVGDVEALDVAGRKADDIVLQIGACSHWSHPHWVRWKVAGGFASCDGYQEAGRLASISPSSTSVGTRCPAGQRAKLVAKPAPSPCRIRTRGATFTWRSFFNDVRLFMTEQGG